MYKLRKLSVIPLLALSIFLLSACAKPTVDPNQKITEIASTVQAELTQMAALTPTVTPTIEPTATATKEPPTPTVEITLGTTTPTVRPTLSSGGLADDAKFVADVTIPDGSTISPGSTFVKTWKFLNTGKTTWTKEYKLVYLEGLQGANDTLFVNLTKDVAPNEEIEISVTFKAPLTNGVQRSSWKLWTASGYPFGEYCSLDIVVGSVTAVPSPTPTNAP